MSGNAPPGRWEIPLILAMLAWDYVKYKVASAWRRVSGRKNND